jgi:two-component system KDP operon response regulator KdpE
MPAKKKILILEDEESIRALIKMGLADNDYTIIEAKDGFSVGATLFEFVPDLIILDLRMARTDGYTVLENIKKFYLEKEKEPPKILIVSAFINEETIEKFKGMPVSDYLSKPFHMENLQKKIADLLKD